MSEPLGPVQLQREVRRCLAEQRLMEAMVLARRGLKVFPQWLDFRVLLAEVFRRKRNRRQAIAQMEALLEIDPEFPDAREALTRLLGPDGMQHSLLEG